MKNPARIKITSEGNVSTIITCSRRGGKNEITRHLSTNKISFAESMESTRYLAHSFTIYRKREQYMQKRKRKDYLNLLLEIKLLSIPSCIFSPLIHSKIDNTSKLFSMVYLLSMPINLLEIRKDRLDPNKDRKKRNKRKKENPFVKIEGLLDSRDIERSTMERRPSLYPFISDTGRYISFEFLLPLLH